MSKVFSILFFPILMVFNCYGQCNEKQLHQTAKFEERSINTINANATRETYTFWGSSIDTVNVESSFNREIWLVKSDSCNRIIFKIHFGFGEGNLDDVEQGLLTVDSGVLFLGYGESVPQGGLYNATLFKLDKNGKMEWKRAYTTPNRDITYGHCITYNFDSTGYLIGGQFAYRGASFYYKAYLLEVDLEGNFVNEKQIIINNDTTSFNSELMYVREVFALADSGYMALIQGGQNDSLYLAKFDKHLNMLWLKRPFQGKYDRLSGTFDATVNQLKQSITIFTLAQPLDSLSYTNAIQWRLFELDTSGEFIRQKPVLEWRPGEQVTESNLQLLNDGGCIIGVDFTRLDSNWNLVATTTFEEWQFPQMYAERADGSLVCAGYQYMPEQDRALIFIQSLSSVGVPLPVQKKPIVVPPPAFSLYPNPATQFVTLANAPTASLVTITDRLGRTVHQTKLEVNSITIGHLQPGMYLVHIELNGNYWAPQKLVIAK